MECACKGCEKRYVGCHSKCEQYAEFVKKNKEKRDNQKYYMMNRTTGWNYYASRNYHG